MSKSLIRLCIDSATKYLFVGLYSNDECLEKYYNKGNNDHSVMIMTTIESMLKNASLKVSDLDQIIVGIGPGSYTGLRIGVVVAKMFGWNHQIDVYTVSSLALLASSTDQDGTILSEIDARRGNSFLGLFHQENHILSFQDKEQLTNLEEYKNSIQSPFVTVSEGEPQFLKLIESGLANKVTDIHQLLPNYLRKTEAERNLE